MASSGSGDGDAAGVVMVAGVAKEAGVGADFRRRVSRAMNDGGNSFQAVSHH